MDPRAGWRIDCLMLQENEGETLEDKFFSELVHHTLVLDDVQLLLADFVRHNHEFVSINVYNGTKHSSFNLNTLILVAESLDIGFAVRIEKLLAALLPRNFKFECGDVPIRPAFLANGAQIGSAKEPVSIVDLVNDKARFQHDHMRNHGIVYGIGVLGDVQILLKRKGQWAPIPLRNSFVWVILSVLIVTSRQ